ncbi:hypothetical protein PR048_007870 [Dryococelus australis]|uniref:Uncharacterized protein n=1 Tax=Dryococelus australis TaxID=614101 RepID=A0ABQ9HVN2_9NEOP|nr:hypothetical protein PR048_007870 [Dryococelus australis]
MFLCVKFSVCVCYVCVHTHTLDETKYVNERKYEYDANENAETKLLRVYALRTPQNTLQRPIRLVCSLFRRHIMMQRALGFELQPLTADSKKILSVLKVKEAKEFNCQANFPVVAVGTNESPHVLAINRFLLGSPLADDRPIMYAVKYRVVFGVVWTNMTMVNSNTYTNRTDGVRLMTNYEYVSENSQQIVESSIEVSIQEVMQARMKFSVVAHGRQPPLPVTYRLDYKQGWIEVQAVNGAKEERVGVETVALERIQIVSSLGYNSDSILLMVVTSTVRQLLTTQLFRHQAVLIYCKNSDFDNDESVLASFYLVGVCCNEAMNLRSSEAQPCTCVGLDLSCARSLSNSYDWYGIHTKRKLPRDQVAIGLARSSQRTLVFGLQYIVFGLQYIVFGLQYIVFGLQYISDLLTVFNFHFGRLSDGMSGPYIASFKRQIRSSGRYTVARCDGICSQLYTVSAHSSNQSPSRFRLKEYCNLSRRGRLADFTPAVRFSVGVAPGFSHMRVVPDDTTGRRVFSGISRFLRPFIPSLPHTHLTLPSSALKTLSGVHKSRWAYLAHAGSHLCKSPCTSRVTAQPSAHFHLSLEVGRVKSSNAQQQACNSTDAEEYPASRTSAGLQKSPWKYSKKCHNTSTFWKLVNGERVEGRVSLEGLVYGVGGDIRRLAANARARRPYQNPRSSVTYPWHGRGSVPDTFMGLQIPRSLPPPPFTPYSNQPYFMPALSCVCTHTAGYRRIISRREWAATVDNYTPRLKPLLENIPKRVACVTPYLAVWDSLLVSLQACYWLRIVQGVSIYCEPIEKSTPVCACLTSSLS